MQPKIPPHLLLILLIPAWIGGCSSVPSDRTPATNASTRDDLLRIAADQIGTPYRYGGNSRGGFDCSGLVEYTHRHVGLSVPRTTASQWRAGRAVENSELTPGDLVFFHFSSGKSRHVGIYEGEGYFIHAPSSGKPVGRASLHNPFWRQRLIGFRSFL